MSERAWTPGWSSMRWRSILEDPPSKTGRYIVAHAGMVGGDAYFFAEECGNNKPGWAQLPSSRPSHWLDMGSVNIPRDTPRFAIDPRDGRKATHEVAQSVLDMWQEIREDEDKQKYL